MSDKNEKVLKTCEVCGKSKLVGNSKQDKKAFGKSVYYHIDYEFYSLIIVHYLYTQVKIMEVDVLAILVVHSLKSASTKCVFKKNQR